MEVEISGLRGGGQPFAYSGRTQLAVVTNIRRYAGGYAVLSPDADADDGEMDLWIFTGKGPGGALRNAWILLRGAHVNDANTHRLPFREVTIETDRPVPMHRDGEAAPDTNRFEISVCPHALKIFSPQTSTSIIGKEG
jgi:diacylglycerol kinase family enzyme